MPLTCPKAIVPLTCPKAVDLPEGCRPVRRPSTCPKAVVSFTCPEAIMPIAGYLSGGRRASRGH